MANNLRRGFWRLWIVVSIVWITGIAALTIPDLRTRGVPGGDVTVVGDGGTQFKFPFGMDETAVRRAFEGLGREPASRDVQPLPPQAIDRLTADYITQSAARQRAADAVFWEEARVDLIAALAPPILLLVAGLAVAWIVRGFTAEARA